MPNRRSTPQWFGLVVLLAPTALMPPACDTPVQQATISAQDFRFDPDTLRLSSDRPIRLTVFNQGREPHIFESPLLTDPSVHIEALSLAPAFGRPTQWQIPPGATLEVRLRAPPGLYHFSCGMRGHRGMRGTVIIEGGATHESSKYQ